jgi:carbohydrate-selective porin OprB
MAIRIACINKSQGYHQDPHHAISHLGWTNDADGKTGKNTRLEIYDWLKTEGAQAYVADRYGNKAYLYPRENANGTKFVQTYADKVWTDNLLSLPECR